RGAGPPGSGRRANRSASSPPPADCCQRVPAAATASAVRPAPPPSSLPRSTRATWHPRSAATIAAARPPTLAPTTIRSAPSRRSADGIGERLSRGGCAKSRKAIREREFEKRVTERRESRRAPLPGSRPRGAASIDQRRGGQLHPGDGRPQRPVDRPLRRSVVLSRAPPRPVPHRAGAECGQVVDARNLRRAHAPAHGLRALLLHRYV